MPLVNPVISRAVPIKVGGAPSAGAGFLASAFDHIHALTETSGPSNLALGDIFDDDMVRRVNALLVGRMLRANNTNGTAATSLTTPTDISSSLNFAIPPSASPAVFYALWVLFYLTAAAGTGLMLSCNITGASSANDRFGVLMATGAATMHSAYATIFDALLGNPTVGPGSTGRVALMFLRTSGAGVGTISPRFASGVAGSSVSIAAQSFGILLQQ
jgi:hypothetical protein